MPKQIYILVFIVVGILTIWSGVTYYFQHTIDQPKYTVVQQNKNYEIQEQGQYGNKTPKYQIGYVLYESVKQAQKAIQLFDEVRGLFPDQIKPLKVDFWQAKDERQDANRDKHVNYVTQLINFVK